MATTITKSTRNSEGVVEQRPSELLAAARKVDASITQDQYTLARVVASEAGNEPGAHQLAIACADVARAKAGNRSIHNCSTGGRDWYGRQGSIRPVSTSLDPTLAHLAIARTAMADPGFAKGAIYYFNPRTQYACWAKPTQCVAAAGQLNKNQHPEAIVRSWSYRLTSAGECGRDAQNRWQCPHGPSQGPKNQWVGQLPGVDPWRLMLFTPTPTAEHEERTQAAFRVVLDGIAGRSGAWAGEGSSSSSSSGLLLAGAAAVGLYLAFGAGGRTDLA